MLDFPEDMQQAIAYLKSTLPELTRLSLPPNPINYALWYVHFSGRRPDLSEAIEQVAKGAATYDDVQIKKLFEKHVCLSNNEVAAQTSARFHLLTTMLQEHLQLSIDSSTRLDKGIKSSRESLRAAIDSNDIEGTVRRIEAVLDEFGTANREFRRTLQDADTEVDRLRMEIERLQQNSTVDDLTRLYNRSTFYRELRRKIEHCRAGSNLCLVLCDLDHFKAINDRFGHLMGDRVLQRIGAVLLEKSREGTLASRYGGEEFALIVDDASLDDATMFAERLRSAIHQMRIKIRNSETVLERLTASFGVAQLREHDTAETLFERADRALYQAKQEGRNVTITEQSI
ncbi:MAG TPA: GGDEF domain-containing protein [Spongiibacteraceae bacterium]|nr:GGDEF domain-containing protein [Spongiibacteraceae bacterium]